MFGWDSFVSQYSECPALPTVEEGWHSEGAQTKCSNLNSYAIDAFKDDE
jgi:hypothetical protein